MNTAEHKTKEVNNLIPYTPMNNAVVLEHEEKTQSGIIIPESVSETLHQESHKVVAVGPNCHQVKVGDRIIVYSVAPNVLIVQGKKYLQIAEHSVAGILHE